MARFCFFALPLLFLGTLPASHATDLTMHADVNRRDGLVDRVLAVEDAEGPALLVFEDPGQQRVSEPERIPLPAPATALAAGRFDEDVFVDILAICGDALVVVHGRDRMLTLSERDVAAAVVSVIPREDEILAALAKRKISFAEIPASGAVLVVDSTGDFPDAAPGDGLCLSSGGGCTLRAAIEEANALAGADTISFSLGAGVPAISPRR